MKVEKVFVSEGLLCVVIKNEEKFLRHRCGYVAVEKCHDFFGKSYNDPDVQTLDVHGGVTFAYIGKSKTDQKCYPIEGTDSLWWFGFDTAHGFDLLKGRVRSLAYCVEECKKLAKQLSREAK